MQMSLHGCPRRVLTQMAKTPGGIIVPLRIRAEKFARKILILQEQGLQRIV